jgi:hypothetical protein
MEDGCKVQRKAWCSYLGAHRPKCSLECMVHRLRGIFGRIESGRTGPEPISKESRGTF